MLIFSAVRTLKMADMGVGICRLVQRYSLLGTTRGAAKIC
jgi:hypothetical protein